MSIDLWLMLGVSLVIFVITFRPTHLVMPFALVTMYTCSGAHDIL